ncbi:MAG: oxidoreductase family protein [Thermodesulfobacteriota bacterium]
MEIKHPQHPEEITVEWINHALKEGGVITTSKVRDIKKEIIGGGKGFISSVLRVELSYDNPEAGCLSSVVVKIEPESEYFKQFGEETHAFQREISFYEEIAAKVDLRLPEVYYSVDKPPAFCLVMEDLNDYIPGNQVIGMHHNKVIATVELIARLQSKYWDNEALDALTWMPHTNSIDISADLWSSFVEHYGYLLSPEAVKLGERLLISINWLLKEKKKRKKTIVHCDLREDNLMFGEPGKSEEILIIDWQFAVKNIGAFDVARLVGGSEIILERQGHEFEVLQYWYKTLLNEGIEGYSWDEAVYDFKLGALFCLCLPIHFHTASIGKKGRAQNLREVMIRGHFTSALEIDAVSVLP